MKLVYDYVGTKRRFPYLLYQHEDDGYYKILLRNRFLYVSQGTRLIERDQGELDIPYIGASRKPIGDLVYDTPDQAKAAFERFRTAPGDTLALVLAGRKP